ncbi:MAG: SDR family oxidoreductase [Rhodobacteraceae bacterium]|nr:SDR family oxidoreductase [Paracoccaceae bacterium]
MKPDAIFSDLEGKSVFITGGGSGIGGALTEGFISQGAKVAFVQRSDATEFCDRLEREFGARPLFIRCDLTNVGQLRQAVDEASSAHGPVDVLVNNAANDMRHVAEEMTVEEWDANQSVNLRPYFFGAQAVVPGMRRSGRGAIVNFTSISYMMGNAGYPAYVAANAGITGLTRALARELGPERIRVNALAPGWVLTDRQMELWATPAALEEHLGRQCLKEHLKPRDIVNGCLFLASSASRMMTGQVLVIDGGVVTTG